jgi:WD40 repeat protein
VWSLDRPGEPLVLRGHEDWVSTVRFSEDGEHLISASDDGTARIWDLRDPRRPMVLRGHEGVVRYADFAAGHRVVTASYDGTVKVWHVDLEESTPSLRERLLAARSFCLSIDQRMLFFEDALFRIRGGGSDHHSADIEWEVSEMIDRRAMTRLAAAALVTGLSCTNTAEDSAVADLLLPDNRSVPEVETAGSALACEGCACPVGCYVATACNAWQTAGGYSVDVRPDHYMFVHGAGSGSWGLFDAWYDYSGMQAVRALGYGTRRPSLARSGTGHLHEWVSDLANAILVMRNAHQSSARPLNDRSLVLITHSFGAIAAECLLEVAGGGNCSGWGPALTPSIQAAALKIKEVHTVQAAHGGCGDSSGAFGCAVADLFGSGVDGCHPVAAIAAISNDTLNINMATATAGGPQAGGVRIRHVRASKDCGAWEFWCDECEGLEAFDHVDFWGENAVELFIDPSSGDLCSDSDQHDGYTQDNAHQDSGRFPGGYGSSTAPGVEVSSRHGGYCHADGDDHPGYLEGASRVRDVVGQTPPCVGWRSYCSCPEPGNGV